MAGQVHLALVPKAEPRPQPRRLELRDQRFLIELFAPCFEVNIFAPAPDDLSSDSRIVYANYRIAECYLHSSRAENRFRLWLDRTAIGITAEEFDAIRDAFPELVVREVH